MAELPFETRTLEQLTPLTSLSPDALTAVQEPGGPVGRVSIKQLLGRLVQTDTAKETEADLLADLALAEPAVALVFADPAPAKNGWYRKTGASGAGTWTQFEKLSAFAAAEIAGYVAQASDSADAATASAQAALAAAGVGQAASTAAGLVDTALGETFWVDDGDGIGTIYRHDAGPIATAIGKFIKDPTGDGAAARIGTKQSGAGSVSRTAGDKFAENLTSGDKGADPTGATDSTVALKNLFADMAVTGRANLLSGTYKVSQPLLIPPGVIEGGDVTFDFSAANPADFGASVEFAAIMVAGRARTKIANLSTNLVIGDRQMVFVAPHGLAVGDSFNISGIVDRAGNGWRTYYTKGEMFRVAKVIGDPNTSTTIVTEGACRDTYPAAGVEVWKRGGDSFTQGVGKLTVICPDTIRYPLYFQRLDRLSVNNVHVEGGDATSLSFDDCFGVTGTGVYARQFTTTFDGYGIGVFNCQDVRIWGSAHGRFNGFVVGGGLTVGGKVGINRDVHFSGVGGSDPITGLAGANVHGNAEYCSFTGVFYNGVILAGNWNEAYGTFISTNSWAAVLFAEMHGYSFKVKGEVVITSGNDLSSAVGAIHMAAFGQIQPPVTGVTTARYGGVTELDIVMRAPKATRLVIWRPLDLARTDIVLKLGLDIVEAHPTTRIVAMTAQGAGFEWPLLQFTRLNSVDNVVAINWSLGSGMKIRGLRRSKAVNVTGTGTSATAPVTFSPAFPRTPVFSASLASNVVLGGVRQIPGFISPSATGGTVQMVAIDGSSQTFNATVSVTAALDEE